MYKNILIYNSGGGLGDSIQLFPLVITLKNAFKGSQLFYLGAHDNHFKNKLKDYNLSLITLNLGLKYFGFRWWHLFSVRKIIREKKIAKFDLIIDLQSKLRNTIILKQIPCKFFYSSTFNFIFSSNRKKILLIKKLDNDFYGVESTIDNLKKILNYNFETFGFSKLSISKKYYDEAKKLLPKSNYIGFSVTQGNVYRKKSWKINNFIDLANRCISAGKKVVFFIEKTEVELINHIKNKIPSSLFPEHLSKISSPALVTALASRLEKAITIDNGIMHMMDLADIPMVVLFGPTNSRKFAPKKRRVIILDSKKMYDSKDINKITVNDVANKIGI